MELGPEDVSLLETCSHFRGCYVQASMELGPEDVLLLERCPHIGGWYTHAQTTLLQGSPYQTSHTHQYNVHNTPLPQAGCKQHSQTPFPQTRTAQGNCLTAKHTLYLYCAMQLNGYVY